MSAASKAFERLSRDQKVEIARKTFEILEYDEDGRPGSEWSSDTLQALGELFPAYGVIFTDPNDTDDDTIGAPR